MICSDVVLETKWEEQRKKVSLFWLKEGHLKLVIEPLKMFAVQLFCFCKKIISFTFF